MADWILNHHCIICPSHDVALQLYQRLEVSSFDGGMRWGFWDSTTVLISTTMRWGYDDTFVTSLCEGLPVSAFNEREKPATQSFGKNVRQALGATDDFLWSSDKDTMALLLEQFKTFDQGCLIKTRRRMNLICRGNPLWLPGLHLFISDPW